MMFYDFPFSFSNPGLRPPWRHLRHAGRQAQSPVDPDLPPQKAAFFGCLLSGYLVHLYVFTNIIPNSDGLSRIFDPQQMTVSGRWFLHFASLFQRLHPDAGGHRPLLRALPRPGRRPGRLSAGHPQPCPLRPVRGADGRLSRRGLHLSLSVHRLRLLLRHFFGGPSVSLARRAGGTGWQAVCSWPAPWAPIRPM